MKYYCIFDQNGDDIFFCHEEKFATLDSLPQGKYDISKCCIDHMECDPEMAYKKDMVTGEITCHQRIRIPKQERVTNEKAVVECNSTENNLQTIALQASLLELKTTFGKFVREEDMEDMISKIEGRIIASKMKSYDDRLSMLESMISSIV